MRRRGLERAAPRRRRWGARRAASASRWAIPAGASPASSSSRHRSAIVRVRPSPRPPRPPVVQPVRRFRHLTGSRGAVLAPNCTTLDQPLTNRVSSPVRPSDCREPRSRSRRCRARSQASSSAGLGLQCSCSPSHIASAHLAVLVGELQLVRGGSLGASDQRRRAFAVMHVVSLGIDHRRGETKGPGEAPARRLAAQPALRLAGSRGAGNH